MRLVSVIALAAVGVAGTASGIFGEPAAPYVVVFADGVDAHAATDALERAHGFHAEHRYSVALGGFAARLAPRQRDAIAGHPSVASVHEDREIRLAPPGRSAPGRGSLASGVRRIEGGAKAASVAVAVIDTGIDLTHPDLQAQAGINCVGGPSRRPSAVIDGNGHGTHVAGTISGRGGIGVAPGTTVYAVKVMDDSGRGTTSQLICGIEWVTTNAARLGIRVANLSLGMPGPSDGDCGRSTHDVLHRAICRSIESGVVYVVAAGNDGSDLSRSVPAAYPEVLTVTAIADSDGLPGARGGATTCATRERDDSFASFSNWAADAGAADHVIAAPGACIRSAWPGKSYRLLSGTSMAAPHVTATVALCITSGRCAGSARDIVRRVLADAAAQATVEYGFAGDERAPVARRHYGDLVWAGGY